MRTLGRNVAAIGLLTLGAPAAEAQPLAVEFRSSASLATSATDQHGVSFTITGLSGVTYLGAAPMVGAHRFLAVMDNSDKLIEIEAVVAADGGITSALVVRGVSIGQVADFEDLALAPSGQSLFLCDEDGPGVRTVALPEFSPLGALPMPPIFITRRANFGFEALAVSRDGRDLWTANEEALAADGPLATPSAGTVVRLLRLHDGGAGHAPAAQHAYGCEPMHGAVVSGARSGLVALVVLPSGRVLALERSFAFNLGGFFRSRLYEVDLAAASDVSALSSLVGELFTPASKTLLWSGNLSNLEGLCVGPVVASGGRALVGIVDDGDPLSTNTLISFRVTGQVEAQCPADYDGSGVADVPDIFQFLSLWFADDPRADFDGNDEHDVADIFSFLAAWFAGC